MIIATDFDGTLTTGEMGRAIGTYLKQHGQGAQYQRFFMRQLPRYIAAKIGLLDVRSFKKGWATNMPHLFKDMKKATMLSMFEAVVEAELWAKRRQDVINELMHLRTQDHRVIIVSGGYHPMLECFASKMGAEAAGTALGFNGDACTGEIVEPLNVGEHKVQRLQALLGGQPLDRAYGDSMDDLPMLEMSKNPVAVYPDAKLRAIAEQRGWRIID